MQSRCCKLCVRFPAESLGGDYVIEIDKNRRFGSVNEIFEQYIPDYSKSLREQQLIDASPEETGKLIGESLVEKFRERLQKFRQRTSPI